MELTDPFLKLRQMIWKDLPEKNPIYKVTGFNSTFGFLAASVTLHTLHGQDLVLRGLREAKYRGEAFSFAAEAGEHIVDLHFDLKGSCTGVVSAPLLRDAHPPCSQPPRRAALLCRPPSRSSASSRMRTP